MWYILCAAKIAESTRPYAEIRFSNLTGAVCCFFRVTKKDSGNVDQLISEFINIQFYYVFPFMSKSELQMESTAVFFQQICIFLLV